ncbi:biotin-dependent carboxyltransferase family protein [Clostridium massiliodielmoense]|uniref:5-oxoprolinase subunit C family protein n=1 Tax=Clostridium massiliodielmoense TaxID=1776385 RepID=UPI000A2676E1|nr:biotin-dependent carboxyltransferase family protein [Clostridium massiliodielmoense]
MGIKIKSPGLLTTIQDGGRYGFRKYGVIVSGAMDEMAFRISNLLVGNNEFDAALEITLIGPKIQIDKDTVISICGGDIEPKVNGIKIPMWRPIFIKKGSTLSFGQCKLGARCYVAFGGSFNVEEVMKSKSTYIRAEIGGYKGRKLNRNDELMLNEPSYMGLKIIKNLSIQANSNGFSYPKWYVSNTIIPKYNVNSIIRVIKGTEFDYFDESSKQSLFKENFIVTPESDRMGYRLKGKELKLKSQLEMLSEAVTLGTIQVPADGNPILLLADRQTTGGYPKIAEAISVDIPILAQLKPGDTIKFKEISLEEAQKLYIKREKDIRNLKTSLKLKFAR